MGHNLPQTLFSSLYIDKLLWPEPKTLESACFKRDVPPSEDNPMLHIVLRAYCLSLIKTCDHVHKQISCEIYYEVCLHDRFQVSYAIAKLTILFRRRTLSQICTIGSYFQTLVQTLSTSF